MLLEVGRVVKPHGIRGEVIVDLLTNRSDRMVAGALFATTTGTLEVEAARPHQGRWIVLFAGVPDRSAAEQLRGVVLSAEPLEDPEALWVHELVGAEVVDGAGRSYGEVAAVEDNPASDLLVLGDGRLVPVAFVVSTEPGRVVVDPPAGLLDDD